MYKAHQRRTGQLFEVVMTKKCTPLWW
jgi:hypothetical protein